MWYGVVLFSMCGMVCYCLVWCGVVWYGLVWCGMVCCGLVCMLWFSIVCMVWHGIAYIPTSSCATLVSV